MLWQGQHPPPLQICRPQAASRLNLYPEQLCYHHRLVITALLWTVSLLLSTAWTLLLMQSQLLARSWISSHHDIMNSNSTIDEFQASNTVALVRSTMNFSVRSHLVWLSLIICTLLGRTSAIHWEIKPAVVLAECTTMAGCGPHSDFGQHLRRCANRDSTESVDFATIQARPALPRLQSGFEIVECVLQPVAIMRRN